MRFGREKTDGDPDRDWEVAELELAMRERDECCVCVVASQTEDAVLSWLVKTNVRDSDTVHRLVEGRGLCARHWRRAADRGGGSFARDAVRPLGRVAAAVLDDTTRGRVRDVSCLVCASAGRREGDALGVIVERMAASAGWESLERSFGLCQPHVAAAAGLAGPDAAARLSRLQARQIDALLREGDFPIGGPEGEARAERWLERLTAKLAGSPR